MTVESAEPPLCFLTDFLAQSPRLAQAHRQSRVSQQKSLDFIFCVLQPNTITSYIKYIYVYYTIV